jgi:hypothetical protein
LAKSKSGHPLRFKKELLLETNQVNNLTPKGGGGGGGGMFPDTLKIKVAW